MSDIDSEIAGIKARIEAGRIAKARAEAVKESAEESEAAAMRRLKDEFGLDSLADARAKLLELQTELQDQLDEITQALDEIEL